MVPFHPTILIIDDDPHLLDATSSLLSRCLGDYARVACATGGLQALAIARAVHPDLIVCDYAMPGMDGPAFVRRARHERSLRHVPIILRGEPRLRERARALDVQGWISTAETVQRLPREVLRLLAATYERESA
jgi:CheY-like chemotaxis protein